ncbi:hypothetical protein DXG01_004122 [Tephrocybe rancida]|nr:hypothetical protein DXG01_004122 [Tephrocybe rancida]
MKHVARASELEADDPSLRLAIKERDGQSTICFLQGFSQGMHLPESDDSTKDVLAKCRAEWNEVPEILKLRDTQLAAAEKELHEIKQKLAALEASFDQAEYTSTAASSSPVERTLPTLDDSRAETSDQRGLVDTTTLPLPSPPSSPFPLSPGGNKHTSGHDSHIDVPQPSDEPVAVKPAPQALPTPLAGPCIQELVLLILEAQKGKQAHTKLNSIFIEARSTPEKDRMPFQEFVLLEWKKDECPSPQPQSDVACPVAPSGQKPSTPLTGSSTCSLPPKTHPGAPSSSKPSTGLTGSSTSFRPSATVAHPVASSSQKPSTSTTRSSTCSPPAVARTVAPSSQKLSTSVSGSSTSSRPSPAVAYPVASSVQNLSSFIGSGSSEIFVDSSAWGIAFIHNGRWLAWQFKPGWNVEGRDNNWAEMVGVELGLLALVSVGCSSRTVTVKSDNSGVVSALGLNKGKKKEARREVLDRIKALAEHHNISLEVKYIASKNNLADKVSRGKLPSALLRFPTTVDLPKDLEPYLSNST